MKCCPVVPEICRGQVHVPRKERKTRRRRMIIIITRYDYNLTIMNSPKPATNTIYPHIKFWWYRTMLNFCGIVFAILKMAAGRNFSMSGINWGHHYLPTYQILMISDNVKFLCRVFAAILKMADILKILKMQNCSSNGDLSLWQILCLYHYPIRSYQH
jgi:hypothetical protein